MGNPKHPAKAGTTKFIPTTPLWHRLQVKTGIRAGPMGEMLTLLPDETVQWLFDITPNGAKLSDTIRGLVVDAHYDEAKNAA